MKSTVRRPGRRAKTAALAAALAVGLGAGIWVWLDGESTISSGPDLVIESADVAISMRSRPARYGTFQLGPVCLNGSGTIEITAIEPKQAAGDAQITAYSTYPFSQLGTESAVDLERLKELKQFKGGKRVSEECRAGQATETQLAVEVENPGESDAFVSGMVIHYRSGGSDHTVDAPFTVGICRDISKSCLASAP